MRCLRGYTLNDNVTECVNGTFSSECGCEIMAPSDESCLLLGMRSGLSGIVAAAAVRSVDGLRASNATPWTLRCWLFV